MRCIFACRVISRIIRAQPFALTVSDASSIVEYLDMRGGNIREDTAPGSVRRFLAWFHHWRMVRRYFSLLRGAHGTSTPVALVDGREYAIMEPPAEGTRQWRMRTVRNSELVEEEVNSSQIIDMEDARVLAGYYW